VRGARRSLFTCALAAAATAAWLAAPGRGAEVAACGKVLPPSRGAYLGAAPALGGLRASRVAAFEQQVGNRLSWVALSQPWSRGLAFPRGQVLSIWRGGAVPYVAFLPTSGAYAPGTAQSGPERRYTLQAIVDGAFDHRLGAWADGARNLGVPLLLSFGADVNEDWGPWNARWNGAGETEGYGDPTYPDGAERYRDAYRHVVELFRAEGATNVAFVFQADAGATGAAWNAARLYYPGDRYVDWLAISAYGSLDSSSPIVPFARRLGGSDVYGTLTRLSRRPAAAFVGTVDDAAQRKPAWIRDVFRALRSGRYPRVRAAVWWEPRDLLGPGGGSARQSVLAALRDGVAGTWFSGRPRFAGDCRPPSPASISARAAGVGTIRVRWSPVPVASSYELYRDGRLLARTTRTSWSDTTAGQRPHRYTVRSVDLGGRSI
jgi:hypothetical protein